MLLTLDEQGVRQFVLVHIRICMCCCLVTMIEIAICNHTPMATAYDSGLILISVEYMTHSYVDFGPTEVIRTFICLSVHLQPFKCVVAWLREIIAIAHL